MSTGYTIGLNEVEYKFQSIEHIYALRREPTLIIKINNETYNYYNFSKLQEVLPTIQLLEAEAFKNKLDRQSQSLDSSFGSTTENQVADPPRIKKTSNNKTMEIFELLKFAGSTIKPITGDNPDEVDPFISNIRLVQALAGDNSLFNTHFVQFVIGKCNGKAHRIAVGCATIEEIIVAIKDGIKRDPSAVIEARLAAVQFDNRNLTDFAEKTEKQADSLYEALISEGCSKAKAMEFTIQKVVDSCRKQARLDIVKSIISSSNFSHHKEVLSKFIMEVARAVDEKKEQRNSNYNNNYNNNNYPRHRWSHNNNQSNNGSYGTNYRRTSNNPNNNNNNNSHSFSSPNNTSSYNNNLRSSSNTQPYIRAFQSENSQLPADRQVGELPDE